MDVKEFFSEPWFWDKHYEVFSEEELSQIEVLSEEETHTIWYEYCDNETLAYCWFVKKIVNQTLPYLCFDCGWGEDETEKKTGRMLREIGKTTRRNSQHLLHRHKRGTGSRQTVLRQMVRILLFGNL